MNQTTSNVIKYIEPKIIKCVWCNKDVINGQVHECNGSLVITEEL